MPRKNQSHTTVGSGLSPSTIGAAQSWSEIAHGAPDALRPAHSGGNSVGHPPPPPPSFPWPARDDPMPESHAGDDARSMHAGENPVQLAISHLRFHFCTN